MKKLKTHQQVILILGIVGVAVGIYGKLSGWEHNDYFVPFYTGISFSWIAFLDTKSNACNLFQRLKK